MRLEPLYRISFAYPEHYLSRGPDTLGLFFGEGRVEGQVTGRFRGLNHARLRSDDVYVPDFHGVIETDDGALLAFHLQGLARKSKSGREVTGNNRPQHRLRALRAAERRGLRLRGRGAPRRHPARGRGASLGAVGQLSVTI